MLKWIKRRTRKKFINNQLKQLNKKVKRARGRHDWAWRMVTQWITFPCLPKRWRNKDLIRVQLKYHSK